MPITPVQYQQFVLNVMSPASKVSREAMLDTAIYGLIGEVGELTDHIKKWRFHGHVLDNEYVKLELGDILWYHSAFHSAIDRELIWLTIAPRVDPATELAEAPKRLAKWVGRLADIDLVADFDVADLLAFIGYDIETLAIAVGSSFDKVIEANVAKLKLRYPDGFSTERSVNRAEGAPEAVHTAEQTL